MSERICGACGNPLGLYYAECWTCFIHADQYAATRPDPTTTPEHEETDR